MVLHDQPDRPRLDDIERGDGQSVSVGGLQAAGAHDVSFGFLVHNLVRGAAGGSVLNAELAVRRMGLLERVVTDGDFRATSEFAPTETSR